MARLDWSLLGCGARGHVTHAPDEPALRERLSIGTSGGPAWRCLRCGSFVLGPPAGMGPVAGAPRVRRGKELRSAFILRLFAVERLIRFVVFAALAVALWRFSVSRLSIEQSFHHEFPIVRQLLVQLGFNVNHSKLLGLIQHTFTLSSHTLAWLAVAAAGYAVIEIIEGIGLWLLKRWGEYFAVVATSVGLPLEVYDLTARVTVLRVLAFVINLALVVYLILSKRLFGARGGKKAYEARLRGESILDEELAALEAAQSLPPDAAPDATAPQGTAPQAAATTPEAGARQAAAPQAASGPQATPPEAAAPEAGARGRRPS